MKRSHSMLHFAVAAALACAAPLALAQNTPQDNSHPQSGAMTHSPPYQPKPMQHPSDAVATGANAMVMGQHDMTGTVESVDSNGMVKVKTGVGTLTLHFPNAAQQLKEGERITLHLGYTTDASAMPPSSM